MTLCDSTIYVCGVVLKGTLNAYLCHSHLLQLVPRYARDMTNANLTFETLRHLSANLVRCYCRMERLHAFSA